jgi:hypothetical protein
MKQITQLLATIKPQNVLSPNEAVTGTDYGTAIQPKTSQPHIQTITTNNDNTTDNVPTQETTNNLLPTTDSLSFWNAVNFILQLNTSFAGMIRDVVVILTGALSSIIGFYFGNRGAITAAKSATEPTDKGSKTGTGSPPTPAPASKGVS